MHDGIKMSALFEKDKTLMHSSLATAPATVSSTPNNNSLCTTVLAGNISRSGRRFQLPHEMVTSSIGVAIGFGFQSPQSVASSSGIGSNFSTAANIAPNWQFFNSTHNHNIIHQFSGSANQKNIDSSMGITGNQLEAPQTYSSFDGLRRQYYQQTALNSLPATGGDEGISAVVESVVASDERQELESNVNIEIKNVVSAFSVRCHLNLRHIARNGINVEFVRERSMVTMRLRSPKTTALIWSSGHITCTGASSEEQSKIAARHYARCLQKLGFRVRFCNFRVVNVLAKCDMPWRINIINFAEKYKKDASYEPELHPGVSYTLKNPKANLKIFSSGNVIVTTKSAAYVQEAMEHIFPLLYEFRSNRIVKLDGQKLNEVTDAQGRNTNEPAKSKIKMRPFGLEEIRSGEDNMFVSDVELFNSDDSD